MKNWACEIGGVEVGKKKGRRNEVSLAMIAADRYASLGLGAVTYLGNMAGPIEISWQVH
jgi:hypothetical protein